MVAVRVFVALGALAVAVAAAGHHHTSERDAMLANLALTHVCRGVFALRNDNDRPLSFTWDFGNARNVAAQHGVVAPHATTLLHNGGGKWANVYVDGERALYTRARDGVKCVTVEPECDGRWRIANPHAYSFSVMARVSAASVPSVAGAVVAVDAAEETLGPYTLPAMDEITVDATTPAGMAQALAAFVGEGPTIDSYRQADRHRGTDVECVTDAPTMEPSPSPPATEAPTEEPTPAASRLLFGTLRDFLVTHPDFFLLSNASANLLTPPIDDDQTVVDTTITDWFGADPGIVAASLAGGRPGYTSSPHFPRGNPSTSGADNFNTWFSDDVELSRAVRYTVEMVETSASSGVYEFEAVPWYPLDGHGWQRWDQAPETNTLFTFEINAQFVHRAGLEFNITTDDDVWVFINDEMVIDGGGLQESRSNWLALDTLSSSLSHGITYSFDIFTTDRLASTESQLRIETNIELMTPTPEPSPYPSPEPTLTPTVIPTPEQAPEPTPEPTASPSPMPTPMPTYYPTPLPTLRPTPDDSALETYTYAPNPPPTPSTPFPTPEPTADPTPGPPTPVPTEVPTPFELFSFGNATVHLDASTSEDLTFFTSGSGNLVAEWMNIGSDTTRTFLAGCGQLSTCAPQWDGDAFGAGLGGVRFTGAGENGTFVESLIQGSYNYSAGEFPPSHDIEVFMIVSREDPSDVPFQRLISSYVSQHPDMAADAEDDDLDPVNWNIKGPCQSNSAFTEPPYGSEYAFGPRIIGWRDTQLNSRVIGDLFLGQSWNLNKPARYVLGELIVFDFALRYEESEEVLSYLRNKWSIGLGPRHQEGLQLWFDAADDYTMDFDFRLGVDRWQDKARSPTDKTTVQNAHAGAADEMPRYARTQLDESLPGLAFDGVNDWFDVGRVRAEQGGFHFFMMMSRPWQAESIYNYQRLFSSWDGATVDDNKSPSWYVHGDFLRSTGFDRIMGPTIIVKSKAEGHVIDNVKIAIQFNLYRRAAMVCSEILVYDRQLSERLELSVIEYLIDKWGYTNMLMIP